MKQLRARTSPSFWERISPRSERTLLCVRGENVSLKGGMYKENVE